MWRLTALRSAGLPYDTLAPLAEKVAPGEAMRQLLLNDSFRSALTWQNPRVIDNWVSDAVVSWRTGGAVEMRDLARRATLVARYAQRYCAKNDTVGHFGPVAWARWTTAPTSCAGDLGVRHGQVYLETWAVEAVARAWNADPELRAHLPVRISPCCSVHGAEIRRPHRRALMMDQSVAAVLAALGEVGRVGEVVDRCGPGADDVLARLTEDGVVQVGFLVPLHSRPERHLRGQVEKVTDPALRERLLAVLDDLELTLAKVPVGPVDPDRLRGALAEVDARLADAAGGSVRRAPALAPGGRTPVYTDCRRDLDVNLGEELLEGLAAPLGVLLDSARWLVGQVGDTVEAQLHRRFDELRTKRADVTLADLQFIAADLLDPGTGALADVWADFQLRWLEILPADGGELPVADRAPAGRHSVPADWPGLGRGQDAQSRPHVAGRSARRTTLGAR